MKECKFCCYEIKKTVKASMIVQQLLGQLRVSDLDVDKFFVYFV